MNGFLNRNLNKNDLLGLQGSTARLYEDFNEENYRFRSSRAVEARRLISIQSSFEKHIDSGAP